MKQNQVINNILGWAAFIISATVYFLTIEPTVSWWDCGEFITSAFKLEVGHPPGAPLFMILGRVFSLFAPDTSKVALMVNSLSALASAATVMFLFWTITHLARKLIKSEKFSLTEQILVFGGGFVGALAYAFTDSFWFSAVESEVYALSSLFTAVVFWAILKWENSADEPHANKWLILIAYLMGLSIGVHLLNLLAIPAITFVYYFKKYKVTWKGITWASIVGIGILGGVMYVVIPGVAKVAFGFDYFFVNTIGMPFNTGVIVMVISIIAAIVFGIRYTQKKGMVLWNTVIVAIVAILIGYSSFGLILIRASANPPMNQNHPDNAYNLLYYLNREQYGDRPLIHGQYFNAPSLGVEGEKSVYNKVNGKYVKTSTTPEGTKYNQQFTTFFPRMYSNKPEHVKVYKDWGDVKGRKIRVKDRNETKTLVKPKFSENIRFFINYQVGHMYMRYFMWNFAGRQNDLQGHGSFDNGNWVSGIKFFDEPRVGPEDILPEHQKNTASNNKYYFLPLLFGIAGLFFQYRQGISGRKDFTITMMLFFFTGLAIVIYLNQYPIQPRERDYAYAGSFYAFAIWIGLAIPAFYSMIKKFARGPIVAGAITLVSLVLVPGILISENFDDHDRSGRYMARDYAKNYLESCAPNALLFTYGDNDTFPLWYVQEVEGVRPDVRIINLSYLGMDWYIDQQSKAQNDYGPVPFTFSRDKYYQGIRDIVFLQDRIKEPIELSQAMEVLGSEDVRSKVKVTSGKLMDFIPSKSFYINVNKDKVLSSGTVKPEDADFIADRIEFSINKNMLMQSEWALLNMVAANNWERPIYVDHSLLYTDQVHFLEWLQFDGLAYRLVPIKTPRRGSFYGRIDSEILYDNVINKFTWGNVNDPDVYIDEYNDKEVRIIQARYMFARLADELLKEGKNDSAIVVLDKMFEIYPDEKIPLSYDSFPAIEQYYKAGAKEKGDEIVRILAKNSFENIEYYTNVPDKFSGTVKGELDREVSNVRNLVIITKRHNQPELNKELDDKLKGLIAELSAKGGN